jgi:hypothetical protein
MAVAAVGLGVTVGVTAAIGTSDALASAHLAAAETQSESSTDGFEWS